MPPRPRERALLLACALLFAAAPAAAQPKEPQKSVLVAPKGVDTPRVPYPEGATGEATVVLELTVGKSGAVEEVKVISGEEPFATAAREAVKSWSFEPATRDGLPVRATIRAKVTFTPPAPPEPPPEEGKPPAPKVPDDKPIEIEVVGERKEAGVTELGGGDVKLMPGTFGDPFRVIEVLPGVTPIVSGLPFFYVRGAPPGNTGYFIDGVRVPMLYHLGAGPSVIAPGLVDRVDFHPSAFPARFGRYTGGIVAGETTPAPTKLRGEWNARVFDASLLVESPVGERGDAMVAGRYGWPGLILSLVSSEASLQYWDYQVRAGYKVTEQDRVSVFFFGAFDKLTDKKRDKVLFDVQFHRADLRWDHAIPQGNVRVATTLMFDQTGVGDDNRNQDDRFAVRMFGVGLRAELIKKLDPIVTFRAGADVWLERFRLVARQSGSDGTDESQFFPSRADITTGLRADFILRPTDRVEIVPGARFDVYVQKDLAVPAIEPRLATRIRLAKKIWSVTTLGVTHQPPSFVVPVPGLRLATLAGGLQTAYQYAQGLEFELPKKITATTTLFHTSFANLSDALAVCAGSDSGCDVDTRVSGSANGLELLLKRPLTETFGFVLAYTLSRSDRTYLGRSAASDFDRTHVLSGAASYDLGGGFRAGLRAAYQSGRPVRIQVDEVAFVKRLPDFYRFDVRLEKRWTHVSLVLEWFNVLLKKEATDFDAGTCRPDGSGCRPTEIGPITIPSIGLDGWF
jgi:TonB family protein